MGKNKNFCFTPCKYSEAATFFQVFRNYCPDIFVSDNLLEEALMKMKAEGVKKAYVGVAEQGEDRIAMFGSNKKELIENSNFDSGNFIEISFEENENGMKTLIRYLKERNKRCP